MKKLGFGLMRLPCIDGNIDHEAVNKLVDEYLSHGFSHFDTAYVYHGGTSEIAFRECVVKRYPREAYTITDKIPGWEVKSQDDYPRVINTQLERCGVNYFDYYWLHGIGRWNYDGWEEQGGFDFLKRLKEEGKAINTGFSFHDNAEFLDMILTKHPEIDCVQLQINYIDWEDEGVQSRLCHEVAVKHGKPVIVMEPVKGGLLASIPEEAERLFKQYHPEMSVASWAIRYAASLPNVINVLSGMSNMDQVNDNVGYMTDFEPLNSEEKEIISQVIEIIHKSIAVPCTGCKYCVDSCPQKIAIPDYFTMYNHMFKYPGSKPPMWRYNQLIKDHGKPSDCIECRECETHCPQHIAIADHLKEFAKAVAA